MDTLAPNAKPDESTDNVAAIVALILLPVAAYVAFAVLDWGNIVSRIGFVVIVPSVIASTVAAIVRAARS